MFERYFYKLRRTQGRAVHHDDRVSFPRLQNETIEVRASLFAIRSVVNLDSRAPLRMTARERRALGNPETGVFLIGFHEEQRTRT